MKVYGLVGPSGTGKSFRAEEIANKISATLIVDDGLLIHNRRILAGFSAKFEMNQIAAIKRAIFSNPNHRTEVHQRITQLSPDALLILGTSVKMVQTIAQALELGNEIEWLSIQNFASHQEMDLASNLRRRGMHAIPIVESQLTEALLPQVIRRLRHRFLAHKSEISLPNRQNLTVVSPLFNEGAVYIHPRAVRDSITQLIVDRQHPFTLRQFFYDPDVNHVLRVHFEAEWNVGLQFHAQRLISDIHHYLKDYLGFPHMFIMVYIDSIAIPHRNERENSRQ